MKRASYRAAIYWIAANMDVEWVDADPATGLGTPSVEACLVEDLFGVTADKVRADLRRECVKLHRLPKRKEAV